MADEPIIGNKRTLEDTPRVAPPPIDSAAKYAELAEALKEYKKIINSAGLHDGITETRLPSGAKKLDDNDKIDIDFDAANKVFIAHLTENIDKIINSTFFKENINISDDLAKAREALKKDLAEEKITDPVLLQIADLATVWQILETHAEKLEAHSESTEVKALEKLAQASKVAILINTQILDVMRLTSPHTAPEMRKYLNKHVDALKIIPLEESEVFNHPRFLAALSKLDATQKKNFETIFKVDPSKIIPAEFSQKTVEELKKLPPVTQQYIVAQKIAVDAELTKMSVIELQAFLNTNKAVIGMEKDLPVNGKPGSKEFLLAFAKAQQHYSKDVPKDKDGKEDETFKAQKLAFTTIKDSLRGSGITETARAYYGLTKLFPDRKDIPVDLSVITLYSLVDYQTKLLAFKDYYGFEPFTPGFDEENLKNPLFLDAYQTAMSKAAVGIAENKARLAKLTFTDEQKAAIQNQFGTTVEDLKASTAKLGTTEATPLDISKAGILVTSAQYYKLLDINKAADQPLINHGSVITLSVQSGPVVQAGIAAALQARPAAQKPPTPEADRTSETTTEEKDEATTRTERAPLVEANTEQATAVIIYGQKALQLEPGKKIGDTEFKLEHWGKLEGEGNPTLAALKQRFLAEYTAHKGTIPIPGASKANFKPEDASAEDMMLFFDALYERRLETYDQNVERYALLESKHETAVENNKKLDSTIRAKLSYASKAHQDEVLENLRNGELLKVRSKEELAKTELYKKLRKEIGEENGSSLDADLWVLVLQVKKINDNLATPNIRQSLKNSIEGSKLSLEQLRGIAGLASYHATGKIPRDLVFDDPKNVRGPGEYAEQTFDDRLFDPQVYVQLRNNGAVSMKFLEYDPDIAKAIEFLGYKGRESLTTEEVGKIAQIRMLEVAKLYGVNDPQQLSEAIFNGTYVPYQGDPEVRLMGDLELVHAGFGKPTRDELPPDYVKFMTDAGLDPYDELNMEGVIARYRNQKFNERYGKPDEAHALNYGHRIGYFRNLDVPKGKTVEEIRASLKGADLAQFNSYIKSLQKVSAFIYFDMMPKEYNDLRWAPKYRNKTLEIINGKAPEPERKVEAAPAPEQRHKTFPAMKSEEAAVILNRSKFAEENSGNLSPAAKEFYILATGYNEKGPHPLEHTRALYYLNDIDGFLAFMNEATPDQIANTLSLPYKTTPDPKDPGFNQDLTGFPYDVAANVLAWATLTGNSDTVQKVTDAFAKFTSEKYEYDAQKLLDRAASGTFFMTINSVSSENPDQLFAHFKLWKDTVFKGHNDAALKQELLHIPGFRYPLFNNSIQNVLSTNPGKLETALSQWKNIAADAGVPFKDMLENVIGYKPAQNDSNSKNYFPFTTWLRKAIEKDISSLPVVWNTLKQACANEGVPFDVNNKHVSEALQLNIIDIAKTGSEQNIRNAWEIVKTEAQTHTDPQRFIFDMAYNLTASSFIGMVKNGTHGIISDILADANIDKDLLTLMKRAVIKNNDKELTPEQLKNLETEFDEAIVKAGSTGHVLDNDQAKKVDACKANAEDFAHKKPANGPVLLAPAPQNCPPQDHPAVQ